MELTFQMGDIKNKQKINPSDNNMLGDKCEEKINSDR